MLLKKTKNFGLRPGTCGGICPFGWSSRREHFTEKSRSHKLEIWNIIELGWLDIHCVQTLRATKTGFGVISEQGVEAIHKVVNNITNIIIYGWHRICLAFALNRVIAFYFVHTFLLILYVITGYLKCCLIYSAFISHVITGPTTLS